MNLAAVAAKYVAHKQSMGMRFRTEARTLKSFCNAVGDVTMEDVSLDKMATFLAGTGPITRFWERKHSVLRGFYRFAIARGYVDQSPLPRNVPRPLQAFEPYIYSREELHRLLDAIIANDYPGNHIVSCTALDFVSVKRSRLPRPMSILPPAS
jgi:integrase/recombinase XerD